MLNTYLNIIKYIACTYLFLLIVETAFCFFINVNTHIKCVHLRENLLEVAKKCINLVTVTLYQKSIRSIR